MDQQYSIQPGTEVFGSDGDKIGKVDAVENGYLVIRKGFFFPKDHYIPTSAISSQGEDGVYLNVTADTAKSQDWDQVPTGGSYTTTGSTGYDTTPLSQTTAYDTTSTTTDTGAYATDRTVDVDRTATRTDEDRLRVPVVEEELTATKTAVERGAVRIETVASEREQTLEVPVTEERVHVERRTVDRPADAADYTNQSGVIEVPVYGEEVDTQKRARVVEEVEISKDAVQETRTVSDTVRRQDVDVVDGTVTTTGTVTDRDVTLDSDLDRGTRRG